MNTDVSTESYRPGSQQQLDNAARAAGLRTPVAGLGALGSIGERILRLPDVKAKVGLGTTAIYQRIKDGDFPPPIKLGRLSGWLESEVQGWINKQVLACRSQMLGMEAP